MISDLQAMNERWNRAWLAKDAATVELLMADDYTYIAPDGVVHDRAAILGVIRSPTYRLDRAARSEVVVRPLGNTAAVVRHRMQSAGTFEGKAFVEDHRCITVCEARDGAWRIVLEQCTVNGGGE